MSKQQFIQMLWPGRITALLCFSFPFHFVLNEWELKLMERWGGFRIITKIWSDTQVGISFSCSCSMLNWEFMLNWRPALLFCWVLRMKYLYLCSRKYLNRCLSPSPVNKSTYTHTLFLLKSTGCWCSKQVAEQNRLLRENLTELHYCALQLGIGNAFLHFL